MVNTDTNGLPLSLASVVLGDIRLLDRRLGGIADSLKGVNVLVEKFKPGTRPRWQGAELSSALNQPPNMFY